MQRAHIITVNVATGESGLFVATSPQMKELFISRETVEEVLDAVPEMIQAVYDIRGETVTVIAADTGPDRSVPWVVLPQDVVNGIRAA